MCVFLNILSIVDEIWHRGITEDSDNQLITGNLSLTVA